MARLERTEQQTNSGLAEQNNVDQAVIAGTQSRDGSRSTTSETHAVQSQSSGDEKTGSNTAFRISFSIPITGRMPVTSASC